MTYTRSHTRPSQKDLGCVVYPLNNKSLEGTVDGQQYTSIVPSSMGVPFSSQAGSKIQTMSECISSL
jgi:hypothetical protein